MCWCVRNVTIQLWIILFPFLGSPFLRISYTDVILERVDSRVLLLSVCNSHFLSTLDRYHFILYLWLLCESSLLYTFWHLYWACCVLNQTVQPQGGAVVCLASLYSIPKVAACQPVAVGMYLKFCLMTSQVYQAPFGNPYISQNLYNTALFSLDFIIFFEISFSFLKTYCKVIQRL